MDRLVLQECPGPPPTVWATDERPVLGRLLQMLDDGRVDVLALVDQASRNSTTTGSRARGGKWYASSVSRLERSDLFDQEAAILRAVHQGA